LGEKCRQQRAISTAARFAKDLQHRKHDDRKKKVKDIPEHKTEASLSLTCGVIDDPLPAVVHLPPSLSEEGKRIRLLNLLYLTTPRPPLPDHFCIFPGTIMET
jgi:hypothetical protein